MIPTLPGVSREHDELLMQHVDELPALGDLIGSAPLAELRPKLDDAAVFLTGLLVPHIDATEQTLYPELERMLQNRHSMTPMRREHAEIRKMVDDLVVMHRDVDSGRLSTGEAVVLRRVVFRLYALLKVHLAEEQLYAGIIEHGVSAEAADALVAAMEQGGTAQV